VRAGDRDLAITPPADFCSLDAANRIDAILLKALADVMRGSNQILAVWSECRDLDAVHRGEANTLTPYIIVLAQLASGRVVTTTQPRAQYLVAIEEAIAEQGGMPGLQSTIEDDVRERFDEVLGQIARDFNAEIEVGSTRLLGIRERDALALYFGSLQRYAVNGVDSMLAGMTGMSLIGGVGLSVNVYDEYVGPATFDRLQAQARGVLERLAADNGS
jgi:hypothetical protein